MKWRYPALISLSVAVIAASAWYIFTAGRGARSEPVERTDVSGPARPDSLADSTLAVRVTVLNGCGRPGVVTPFVRALRERGFDVVNGMGGNADSFEFVRSVVVDRRGNRGNAERIARCLGIRTVLSQHSDNQYLMEDVAVIVGRDWDTLIDR
jgi:hypothetical protein